MINRVLIRIKVIQLLYSYLLIENNFMLESQPTPPTKEKRFAYSLYLDTLVLMTKVASKIERRGAGRPLENTRFINKITADDKVRTLINRYHMEEFPFESVVDQIAAAVKESGIYKHFIKLQDDGTQMADSVWQELFDLIISRDADYNALIEKRPNFTLRGVDRMKQMMADTFRKFFASRDNIDDALAELGKSLDKARELYLRLLALPADITFLRERRIEDNRRKFIRTEEDINPNMRFVENQLAQRLAHDPAILPVLDKRGASWLPDDRQLLERILKEIMNSTVYKEYMDFPVTDMKMDCELWRNLMKQVIFQNEDFLEYLEDKSVFWNDDLEIIGTFVLKTFKRMEDEDATGAVLNMYKDEEDARFGRDLFTRVVRNKDSYRSLIDKAIEGGAWDTERLAFMDVVIIMTALAEITGFPKIPLQVSVNEYIELAKSYSTPKSGAFVNGVLGNIIKKLQEEGKLDKR